MIAKKEMWLNLDLTLEWNYQEMYEQIFKELCLGKRDTQKKRDALNCIMSNLKFCKETNIKLMIKRSPKDYIQDRYTPKFYSYRILIGIVDKLISKSYINSEKGVYDIIDKSKNRCSVICPTKELSQIFSYCKIVQNKNRELVILHEVNKQTGRKELVEYSDTREVIRLRAKLKNYNEYIIENEVYIEVNKNIYKNIINTNTNPPNITPTLPLRGTVSKVQKSDMLNIQEVNGVSFPPSKKREKFIVFPVNSELKSIYCRGKTMPFKAGGRLYTSSINGVQNIRKELRKYIKIKGEDTIELDYSSLHITMLYHKEKIEFSSDGYDIGLDKKYRPIIKRMMLTMINAKSNQSALGSLREYINSSELTRIKYGVLDIKDILNKLKKLHKPIKKYLCSDIGIKLQLIDSAIMLNIIMKLKSKKIIALPIHDSIILPKKYKEIGKEIMLSSYKSKLKYYPVIEEK